MNEKEWTSDPAIHCPACGKTHRDEDAWELRRGFEVECPHCGATLVCEDEDVSP